MNSLVYIKMSLDHMFNLHVASRLLARNVDCEHQALYYINWAIPLNWHTHLRSVNVPHGCLTYPVAQPDASYATGHPVAQLGARCITY